ncbi:TniB family NTP-binding protein [Ekhidna sp.]|uniref:TniB family NTP-binding protein n=1 Tax=Ekhidna sp. TaxID=2608089 RepID=UPI003298C8E3
MMKHLPEQVQNFIENSTDEQRVENIKKFKWIGYSLAQKTIAEFENLLTYPRSHRMPNILLVGDSNNGKTAILNRFIKKNESFVDENTGELRVPALMIQAPPEPDEKRFYNSILEELFAPIKSSEKPSIRQQRVIHLLKRTDTKVLVIDEIHHILAGTMTRQRVFLNVLKYLSNELKISLVCAGTRDAFNAIQTDPQLANRFNPKVIKKWKNDEEFLRLLASFERILPLKKNSQLIESGIAMKVLAMSEGLIGEIAKILELSAILAIESGIEKITKSVLDNIEFVSPGDRKKMLYKM